MLSCPRGILFSVVFTASAAPLAAQGDWVGHEPPCELSTGHYLIRGGIVYLQQAVETRFPDQRDGRLAEAERVLTEAVTEAGRADDPAAWYYLGRYYVEKSDGAGADSAFGRAEDLAPACTPDINRHRARVGPLALNEALRTWGEQALDSAAYFFRLAMRLMPENAEVPLHLATLYSGSGQLDSAQRYVTLGVELAGGDEQYERRRREALLGLARGYEAVAYQDQTVIQGPRARVTRDTVQETVARDSTILAQMVGRVSEIRQAGRQLDAQSLQAFQQESTTVATRLAGTVGVRDSAARQAAADSQTAAPLLEPAVAAYRAFVEAYPDDGDAMMKLARLYSAAGHRDALDALVQQVAASEAIETSAMVQGALSLSNEGQTSAARRLLEASLERNPYDYNALFVLGRMMYTERDPALQDVAGRLYALDPLSQNTLRTVAMSFDVAGQRDSVQHYVNLANGGVGWNVRVTQFTPRDSTTALSGAVTNVGRDPLLPVTLVFEFLDAEGAVLFSETVDLPALEPRGRERISIRRDEGGVVAWRYRRQ